MFAKHITMLSTKISDIHVSNTTVDTDLLRQLDIISAAMMKLRKHLLLWLLPLLALRGLVPAGFMIDTSHGAMSVIVCPGHQTQHHPDNSGKTGGTDSASLCAFAAAAGAAPIVDLPAVALGSLLAVDRVSDFVSALDLPFGPTRAQQSRAPPFNS